MGEKKKDNEITPAGQDVESSDKKLPYPKQVFFILIMEFCERFCYYGMRAVLGLFLKNVLKFSENTSTVLFHSFNVFAYLTPLFGAMLADSLLGKFRTIFYLSVVYVIGNIVLSLGATPPLNLPAVAFSMIGLALIAIGTGGIKPCVAAFGGDQFVVPQQEAQLVGFFSIYYASINCGSLVSTFITPIFRKDVKCFGDDTCYPLAFAVPAALMITALVVFLVGRFMYTIRKPTGNVIAIVAKTIAHAISRKRKLKGEKRDHWLDYADDKYGKRDIEDIKILLNILFLYIPLPVFWSLYDQQGSRWTFQASRMDGDLGGFVLKPDQMQVINSILILLFIPLFEKGIYPLFAKVNLLKSPLQRLAVGLVFAGLSFVISGAVELELQKTYPAEIGGGEAHLHFVNMGKFNLTGNLVLEGGKEPVAKDFLLNSNSDYLPGIVDEGIYTLSVAGGPGNKDFKFTFPLIEDQASTILLVNDDKGDIQFILPKDTIKDPEKAVGDQLEKSGEGNPFVSVLQHGLWLNPIVNDKWNEDIAKENRRFEIVLRDKKKGDKKATYAFTEDQAEYSGWNTAPALEIDPKTYRIYINEIKLDKEGEEESSAETELKDITFEVLSGGSYIITLAGDRTKPGDFTVHLSTITEPNTLHMLWLIPQYVVMTAGEIMFSVTILDFSYTQAPKSMKSFMQSAWLLTVMFGNVIDIIVVELGLFKEQWKEFFLFAGIMFADVVVFSYLGYRYKPADLSKSTDFSDEIEDEDEDNDGDNNTKKGRDNHSYNADKDD